MLNVSGGCAVRFALMPHQLESFSEFAVKLRPGIPHHR
jgi:hypothetical protein